MGLDLPTFEFEVAFVNGNGQEVKRHPGQACYRVEQLSPATALEMVALPAGTFIMGADESELGWHATQSPPHSVSLPNFFISKFPITQAQWQTVAAFEKVEIELQPLPSCFIGRDRPVEQISWYEAVEFCARLSRRSGREYRLPSEAEWEYCARGGTTTPFHFGETITTDLANYSGTNWEYDGRICASGAYGEGPLGEDRRETTSVGYFQVANPFGLYDIHGLVREWCADPWHSRYDGAPDDGTVWTARGSGEKYIVRGGSWNAAPKLCRSAYRSRFDRDGSLYDIGFRVACST
ncbi:MAG: formylglycine-generating enzyme family protein [Cyanobacteriota bacterium]|nr:formylglycine-generating enzyme family protein [Cyanobacteriota bacterium]